MCASEIPCRSSEITSFWCSRVFTRDCITASRIFLPSDNTAEAAASLAIFLALSDISESRSCCRSPYGWFVKETGMQAHALCTAVLLFGILRVGLVSSAVQEPCSPPASAVMKQFEIRNHGALIMQTPPRFSCPSSSSTSVSLHRPKTEGGATQSPRKRHIVNWAVHY